jgi:hypothetical protein
MAKPEDTLDMIREYMKPVRDKVAAVESYQDNPQNTVESNDKKVAKDSQTNIGLEQSEDAKDGGSTIEDETGNTDALQAKPEDTQGPQTLSTDDPVTDKGNIGPIVQQEITQQQKTASETARITNLANAILPELQKVANAIGSKNAANPQTIQKTAAEQAVDTAGEEFKYYYALGMQKRAADEAELEKSASVKWQKEIEALGGVGAVLDKIAMETPEAVIPPEALAPAAPDMGGMGEEAPLGGEPGGEAVDPELAEEISEADINMIAEALAAEGITAEDMENALSDATSMSDAGVQAPELAQALSGEEVPPPTEDMGEVEKVAAVQNRQTVEQIRNFIFREV